MNAPAVLSAVVLLAGCSSPLSDSPSRGYAAGGPSACPGGAGEGDVWCAPCHVIAGEPQFRQHVCENGQVRNYGPCTTEKVCKASAPVSTEAQGWLVVYDINAPDRGCNQPGKGDRAVMLLNRSKERAITATVRSAHTGPQSVTVPAGDQIRLGCFAERDQPANWTVQQAGWGP